MQLLFSLQACVRARVCVGSGRPSYVTFGSNACQLHTLFSDEGECLADVGNLVNPHLSLSLGHTELVAGD